MVNEERRHGDSLIRRFITDGWRLVQMAVALFALYRLAAHVFTTTWVLATQGMPAAKAHAALMVPGVTVTLPDPVAEILIACIVTGVITYILMKWVCQSQWVQETVQVEECWEEVKWYNPWSWFVAIVCTVKEVVKWVFQQICGWVGILVTILVVACIVIGIIVLVA